MGYNLSGIAINKNFKKSNEEFLKHLKWPGEFVKNITYEESSTTYHDENTFDIFFSESGTLILCAPKEEINKQISKGNRTVRFMLTETAMAFSYGVLEDTKEIREYFEHETEVKLNVGEELDAEKGEDDAMEKTMNVIASIFGENLYQFDLDHIGYRYKLIKLENTIQHKAPFYDSNSMATNAGKLSLNFIQWTKMNFGTILKNKIALVVSFSLMIKLHWLFGIVFLAALLYNVSVSYTHLTLPTIYSV